MQKDVMVESLVAGDGELVILEGDEIPNVVRGAYRVGLKEGEARLFVGGETLPVLDVSRFGLGVAVDDVEGFEPGSVFENARLEMAGQSFAVDVEVVHISADVGQYLRCGMAVVKAEDAFAAFMEDFMARRRESLRAEGES